MKIRVKIQYNDLNEMLFAKTPEIAGYHCNWVARDAMNKTIKYVFIPTVPDKE